MLIKDELDYGDLAPLLNPGSIAVLGASTDPKKVGGRVVAFLKTYGYAGAIYPVNGRTDEVQGIKSYASVKAIQAPVDLALISLPTSLVLESVRECAEAGVKSCVIFTSGFGEVGEAGKQQQQAILEIARNAGMRVMGPNCQGIVNTGSRSVVSFATSFASGEMNQGAAAVFSQSGAVAQMVYNHYQRVGKGVRYWAATGNEADVQVAELIQAATRDPQVKVIQIYLESIADGAALIRAGKQARQLNTPVLAMKAGRSEVGQQAASSHTGAIAAEDAVVDAALKSAGIIRVDSVEEMVAAGHLFESGRPVNGRRVAVLSNSGAVGVMMVDAAQREGLDVVTFTEDTQRQLAEVLPAFASSRNPIDVTAQFLQDRALIPNALRILAEDDGIDAICVGLGIIGQGYDIDAIVQDIVDANSQTDKLITLSWVGCKEDATARFFAGGVPAFEDYNLCMKALSTYATFNNSRDGLFEAASLDGAPKGDAVEVYRVPASNTLNEYRSKALLKSWGLPVTRERLTRSADEAVEAAGAIGYPVVAKVVSDKIPHKTEIGGVALNLRDSASVAEAFERIQANAREIVSDSDIEGILVQSMSSGVIEMSLGCKNDPVFGPVVMVAAGGIYIEVLKDFKLLLPPVSRSQALEAMESLVVAPLLQGARGKAKADVGALADLVVAFSHFVVSNRDVIQEIDLNPVIVKSEGEGVEIVDALIELSAPR